MPSLFVQHERSLKKGDSELQWVGLTWHRFSWGGHVFNRTKVRHRLKKMEREREREAKLLCSSRPAIRSPSTLVLITGCLWAISLSSSILLSLLPSLCLPCRSWFMSAALGRVGWRGRDTASEGERERERGEKSRSEEKKEKETSKAKLKGCIRERRENWAERRKQDTKGWMRILSKEGEITEWRRRKFRWQDRERCWTVLRCLTLIYIFVGLYFTAW